MAIYGRGFSFNLDELDMDDYGAFSGDGRIVHASSIFMIILPFLWYLNKFIKTKKAFNIIPIVFCFIVILVHQHRSVWSSSIVALFIYLGISMRINKGSIPRIWSFMVSGVIILFFTYFFISTLFPELTDFLGDRFSEIFAPNQEGGTGHFRAQQRETYGELFLQRPFFGWNFE